MRAYRVAIAIAGAVLLAGCAADHEEADHTVPDMVQGEDLIIAAAARPSFMSVSGSAEPIREATLGTKLMGAVTRVSAQEGDVVRAGQALVHIDARDLAAKTAQLEAALAEAEAVYREADLHAERMRALYADDAAPKAHLDAAETGLARARAGVDAVRANRAELTAIAEYSVIRAPFDGIVVRRMVDPGSFAAPGSPLIVLQDDAALRISATAAPDAVRGLERGQEIGATIEGESVIARIEGVVPAAGGNLYTVNAVVPNPGRAYPARGTATLALPLGVRATIVVPSAAIVRQADMTGVHLRREGGTLLRWVRTAPWVADSVEVLAGLRDGDVIVVPDRRGDGSPVVAQPARTER